MRTIDLKFFRSIRFILLSVATLLKLTEGATTLKCPADVSNLLISATG